ncbi:hypothetical protein C9J85_00480 [Haloferax sp. wsp5]|nr:hypothetical protein C9J85_00480 [Haloferax sp. wsp5]
MHRTCRRCHEDSERATEELRQHIAYYVGSGEGYRRAVAETYRTERSASPTPGRRVTAARRRSSSLRNDG